MERSNCCSHLKKAFSMTLQKLRPINILSPLAKVIEHAIKNQLRDHVNAPVLNQSRFHKNSTVTPLHNMTQEIYNTNDQNKNTALVLLDLSKTFDLVNHNFLSATV